MVGSLKAEQTAEALIDELSQKKFTPEDIEKMLLDLRGEEGGQRSVRAIIEA